MEAATLEAPAPVQPEAPALVPQPTIAELLEQHLDHSQQKKIAVKNLSRIKFLIAPDGKSAISAEELKTDKHRQIVEDSLKTILGHRAEDAPYLPPADGLADKLGLGSNFVELTGAGTIKRLAEAGVKDLADALGIDRHHSHAARVK